MSAPPTSAKTAAEAAAATPATAKRSRTITWSDPAPNLELMRQMSGLEFLRMALTDHREGAPIAEVLDFRPVLFEVGRAVFEGQPAEYHYNPIGTVHGGYITALLDSAMGCAVHTTLAAGNGYTTVELKVNFVRAMRASTGPVTAEGKVINVGSRIATAEARLTDRAGKLYAHATTTCLIFPL
jgi:uncharacterized protein (TIGR00369 family)